MVTETWTPGKGIQIMYAELTDDLLTGNKTIDTQHKELIDKINDLLKSCETGKEKATSIRTLDFLSGYTDFHFKAEESLQENASYPGIEKHKEQHRAFEQSIKELYNMLQEEEGPSPAFVKAVETNVVEWLYTHIQGFDRSVAEYINLNSNGELL